MRANPDKLAKLCLDCFGDKKEPIYIKGDTITTVDSVLRVDSIRVQVDCPDGAKVDCPPVKTITRIIKSHSTDSIQVDRWQTLAYIKILESEKDKVSKDRDKVVSSRDGWRTASLWGWGIIGGYLLIVFIRKRLP